MERRLLLALVLLSLAAVPLRADPTVSTYSFTPDLAAYGPGVAVEVHMQIAGGQPNSYKLLLQTELVSPRAWDVVVDLFHGRSTGGDPQSPFEVDVPAEASTITVSLNGTTPNLNPQQPKILFRADWKDSAGTLHLFKSERRQVGPVSVAATPAPTPTPSATPTPTPSPTPTPASRNGSLKVVLEPPGLTASIYVDGKFGGNGSYEATGLALGQYLVAFGDAAGYEKPASQTVTLSESRPSVLLRGEYRAVAATPAPSPSPTPTPATPSPTPPPAAPAIPLAAVGGAVAVAVAAGAVALVLKKRKAGPPPPPSEAPPPEAPPPEPPAAPQEAESLPEEVSLGVLQEKKQKIESRKARLEEQKEKGEVTAEEYEEKRKRYEREIEELSKEITKKGGS